MRPRTTPMGLVLALRARREEAEERALAAAIARERSAALRLDAVHAQRSAVIEERHARVGQLCTGAEHCELAAMLWGVNERLAAAAAELKLTRDARTRQLLSYSNARCERERVADLLDARRAAHEVIRERAEQRRSEDLFLARVARMRNSLPAVLCTADVSGTRA